MIEKIKAYKNNRKLLRLIKEKLKRILNFGSLVRVFFSSYVTVVFISQILN